MMATATSPWTFPTIPHPPPSRFQPKHPTCAKSAASPPSFTCALSTLYPRTQHPSQWSKETAPPPDLRLSDLLTTHSEQNLHEHEQSPSNHDRTRSRGTAPATDRGTRAELTSVAKYVLVAAFLASFNPAKTDARLLGRAPDERGKTRKRRGGGGPRKPRGGGRAKVYTLGLLAQ